jgi:putative serine protease PepD
VVVAEYARPTLRDVPWRLSDALIGLSGPLLAGGAAEWAGLRPGDLILTVAGEPVRSGEDVRDRLRFHPPGAAVAITYRRDGETRTAQAVPQSRWQVLPP